MFRRRSQSIQKSQKSQSVRPNSLDGLDRLLTTLSVPSILTSCTFMSPDEFTPSYRLLSGVVQPSQSHTFCQGRLNGYKYDHPRRYFIHSLVSLLDMNASVCLFHTALKNRIGITGNYISSSAKPLSRLCGRRGAVPIHIFNEFALLARSTFNQAVDSDTYKSYCPRIYPLSHVTF